jgi:enoyl-CoA hydratase
MLMTGRLLTGKEAERIGLVNHCVSSEKVMSTALEIAHNLANGPPKAIRWTKMAVNKFLLEQVHCILPTSAALEYLTMHTQDHEEATAAFIENRQGKFTGK